MRNPLSWLFGRRDHEPEPLPPRPDRKARLSPDGLPITEFAAPITRILRLYYGAGGSYAQLYASNQNLRTVVGLIAREAAELTLKMYEKVPRSPLLADGRLEIDDHPMMQLLAEPVPGTSPFQFWFALFADIEIYDVAYWQKIRTTPGGPPRALLRLPPASLTPVRHPITNAVESVRAYNGEVVPLQDLVSFWGYDPGVNTGNISPMETLRRTIAEELAAGQNREGMWENSARKDGIIEPSVDSQMMSDEARESYLLDIEDALAGQAGSGRPLMLYPGHSWKDVQWSPREMEYIQGRKLTRTEVAAAFWVPPALVAAAANNQEPDDTTLKIFYSSSLPPRLTRVEDTIQAQLLPEFDQSAAIRRRRYVEFNLAQKLRGSFEEQAAIMATTAGGPVITVNEARGRLNLPPIEGGDLIFVPLNSIRAGGPQASPQNPVQTPATGVQPAGTTPGGALAVLGDDQAAKLLSDARGATVEEVIASYDARVAEQKSAADHAAFLKASRTRYEERHARMLEHYFSRQRKSLGGSKKAADSARWNRELADDVFGVQLQTVEAFGADAADRIGGAWDTARTANYLKQRSQNLAESTNAETAQRLSVEGADPDEIFGDARVGSFAKTQTTFAMNWAIQEAAHQNEA